ncbi:FliA/WhiG family RNA polymerase sigma factor [Thermotalea metallivorans]|uniref:RNA polymerase sigma factor n=1 Tax=Thermotalea metallivorans TaxID=520762 RepID=A0A140L5F0_9FIRM|nr:FliA/WhiG family RNA polymerase sigma factor [Thermotalea metallivorans]KXG75775.1 RNA polymerase sigma-D factor [Thermotalea metallivorans]
MSNHRLWDQYTKTKDKSIKDQLILSYIDFVKIVAGRLYNNYGNQIEFEDLVSYGIFGLLDAIDKFDPGKNVKFETYAYIRIRGAIIDQLRNLDWIPRSVRQKYKKLEDAYKSIENQRGRSADDEEVAAILGISLDELNEMLADVHSFTVVSLEEKILNNANFSVIDDDINNEPQQYFEKEEMKRILIESINSLPERERKIISLYYYSELTYKEISHIMGISESRISQLHTKAIMRLKAKLEKTG